MRTSSGFSIVELLMALVLLGFVGAVGIDRFEAVKVVHRDQDRKISVNAIHYNLEEVVKPALGGYPKNLSADQLSAMDAGLLKDPRGITIGRADSDFRYEPTDCGGTDLCQGYRLSARLEREADFVRQSPGA